MTKLQNLIVIRSGKRTLRMKWQKVMHIIEIRKSHLQHLDFCKRIFLFIIQHQNFWRRYSEYLRPIEIAMQLACSYVEVSQKVVKNPQKKYETLNLVTITFEKSKNTKTLEKRYQTCPKTNKVIFQSNSILAREQMLRLHF